MCSIFIMFSPNDSAEIIMKNASYLILKSLFILKIFKSFYFRLRLFFSVCNCFRGWSKISLKGYDVINCLNKNLIAYYNWYLEKEKRYDIKTLKIDGVLNRKHFFRKIMQKMYKNLVLDPFLILLNNPKRPLHAINFFKDKTFWKRIIKKPWKS